ncbi:S8 family peptidase [Chryseobacterium sp. NKUCC03_KSP]|uniref:S8 family peptidase n=1 Tax=Chryseobacterium sp. NKUCC03_KSP TaxID=2842125 RepID=UPI001C5BF4D7|nr:S8 family peptidase [Chryseobacterium sp. NKUCC03_KSP]MBW3524693.1 S8 family peptidase [Chryseobacterium sp. NKUCC03_KSP]
MADFPHLKLARKLFGTYNFPVGGSSKKNPETTTNLQNRERHGGKLKGQLAQLKSSWDSQLALRREAGLPEIYAAGIRPIFLQIDLDAFTLESLHHWGIEILSEEDNGYIIGVSVDDFSSLSAKIDQFLTSTGRYKDKAAQMWQINDGLQWRLEQILTPELNSKWDQIVDDQEYVVYAGIACYKFIKDYPVKKTLDTEADYLEKIAIWESEKRSVIEARDDEAFARQDKLDELITLYGGEQISSYIDFEDSYYISFQIVGKGLKDIAISFPYLYELGEINPYKVPEGSAEGITEINPNLTPPLDSDPKICVIDSGIQEHHRLLEQAIDTPSSFSFIPGDATVADRVNGGGHGTKVAGAVLYGSIIPKNGAYQLPFWIQNARVLNADNELPSGVDPAQLMLDVVEQFDTTRIFNLSIATSEAFNGTHMSPWASTIDKISYEKDKLFVIAAGNIARTSNTSIPGLSELINSGALYPDYLFNLASAKISNPAISAFGLTVGSACLDQYDDLDKKSFGEKDSPSSFTRTGLGMWNMIKPEVVEYGGDFVHEKEGAKLLSNHETVSPELVSSTLGGGGAISRSSVGTSFAAPMVTHIAGWLIKNFPTLSAISYKALIVQAARLPQNKFREPSLNDLRCFGYGIPTLQRATQNTENRVTFLTEGTVKAKGADVFMIKVPAEINRPGLDNEILLEITLNFHAKVRRTRKYTKSYLSSWLSWEISTPDENYDEFCGRVIKSIDNPNVVNGGGRNGLSWTIFNRSNNGIVRDVKRQDSSTQKDWTIVSSNKLPNEFCIAVVGHHGWDKDLKSEIPYSLVVSFESLDTNIPIYQQFEIENRIELDQEVNVQTNGFNE